MEEWHGGVAVELLCNDARPIPCFEINLVKRDGGRVNVVSHRDRNNIILDAQILSEYLRLPIVGKV